MADVELGELRDRRDRNDIVEGEAVAGMRLDPVLRGERGGVGDAAKLVGRIGGMGIGAGMKFDDGRAKAHRRFDLAGIGLDEQADPDSGIAEPRNEGLELIELRRISDAAALAAKNGIEPHAGHGLTYDNVVPVAAIPQLAELNIGHFLVGEAIFTGLDASVRRMRELMDNAR